MSHGDGLHALPPRGRYPSPVTRASLALLLALAVLVAACGGSTPSSAKPGTTSGPTSSSEPASGDPGTTPDPGASGAPTSPDPGASDTPATPDPGSSDTPATDEPSTSPDSSATSGPADACSGSDANREFYAGIGKAVDWPVLCAVLPKGWFVSSGSYRLANGGKLVISYKGPQGSTLTLSEGAFCATADGCVPSGAELGDTPLGPLTGTLVGLDAGDYAVVVDRGLVPSWLMVTTGLDQATATAYAAALAEVGN